MEIINQERFLMLLEIANDIDTNDLVYKNTSHFINSISDTAFQRITEKCVNEHGTVSIVFDLGMCEVEIGRQTFSYYVEKSTGTKFFSYRPLDKENLKLFEENLTL